MGYSHGKRWDELSIEAALRPFVQTTGRMPSANELRAAGANDIACAVSRGGGYLFWAKKLSVAQKGTETHRGQSWERNEAALFRSLRWDVRPQTTKAEFDILVNGHRVDVKMSLWHEYQTKTHVCRGFTFAGIGQCAGCDFLDLVCVNGHYVVCRFVVPARAARVETITITPSALRGRGRYGQWVNRLDLLRR